MRHFRFTKYLLLFAIGAASVCAAPPSSDTNSVASESTIHVDQNSTKSEPPPSPTVATHSEGAPTAESHSPTKETDSSPSKTPSGQPSPEKATENSTSKENTQPGQKHDEKKATKAASTADDKKDTIRPEDIDKNYFSKDKKKKHEVGFIRRLWRKIKDLLYNWIGKHLYVRDLGKPLPEPKLGPNAKYHEDQVKKLEEMIKKHKEFAAKLRGKASKEKEKPKNHNQKITEEFETLAQQNRDLAENEPNEFEKANLLKLAAKQEALAEKYRGFMKRENGGGEK